MKPIYRYFRPHEWNYLFPEKGTGTIRFTPIPETNDPHEGKVDLLGVARDKHDLMRLKDVRHIDGLSNVIDLVSKLPEQDIKIALNTYGKMFYDELRKRRPHFGIFSATSNNKSTVMWEHYGVKHTGFMVEFNASHPLFNAPHGLENVFGTLQKVNYSTEMPKKYLTDLIFNPTEVYCKKHNDWKYEDEVRIIYGLDHEVFLDGSIKGCTPIKIDLIKSVTFGCRCSWEKLACQIQRNPMYDKIQLFKASIEEDSYTLSYEPLPSNYCQFHKV